MLTQLKIVNAEEVLSVRKYYQQKNGKRYKINHQQWKSNNEDLKEKAQNNMKINVSNVERRGIGLVPVIRQSKILLIMMAWLT